MGRKCRKCGQRTGPNRRLCKMCSLDKRYGNDPTEDRVDEDPDELKYECTNCGHEYVGTLSDDCPECGHNRCRYAGSLPGDGSESTDDTNRVTF